MVKAHHSQAGCTPPTSYAGVSTELLSSSSGSAAIPQRDVYQDVISTGEQIKIWNMLRSGRFYVRYDGDIAPSGRPLPGAENRRSPSPGSYHLLGENVSLFADSLELT